MLLKFFPRLIQNLKKPKMKLSREISADLLPVVTQVIFNARVKAFEKTAS